MRDSLCVNGLVLIDTGSNSNGCMQKRLVSESWSNNQTRLGDMPDRSIICNLSSYLVN